MPMVICLEGAQDFNKKGAAIIPVDMPEADLIKLLLLVLCIVGQVKKKDRNDILPFFRFYCLLIGLFINE